MARNTRLATTVTARYTPSVGAVDAFYLDGRIAGRREEQFADITLDRDDRGSFFAVYASSHGSRSETHNNDGNRQFLDQIANDLKKNNRRNIDYEINELAECVVNVSGRLTLADAAIRQPYFSGIIIKDGEMAAITLGRGCAYLYRDETLYPLTQDEYPLEAIDGNGRKVANMNDFSAGIAGTIRYSNIAQLKQDDCIIMCNKEVMEAIGQRQMLRILDLAEDQSEAAGMIMDLAASENEHISMQFMIGFVEDITNVDRLGRATLAKGFTSRITDRTGSKNTESLFAGFEDPYKAPPAPKAKPLAPQEDEIAMADTKPAMDLPAMGAPLPTEADTYTSDETTSLVDLSDPFAEAKLQQHFSNSESEAEVQEPELQDDAQRTDFYQDLSQDDSADGGIDYSGFGSAHDDYDDLDQTPIYAAETPEQFEGDQGLYSDDDWDDEAASVYGDTYGDRDRAKKIAVAALAVVAVILLFFIIKSLATGGKGGETNPSLPSDTLVGESTPLVSDSSDTIESSSEATESTSEATESSETPSESDDAEPTPTESNEAPSEATPTPTAPTTTAPTTAPTTTAPTTTAPTTTVAPTEPPAPNTYVVQAGDTLFSIVEKLYGGDFSYIEKIANLNGFGSEDFIQEGQELILPAE